MKFTKFSFDGISKPGQVFKVTADGQRVKYEMLDQNSRPLSRAAITAVLRDREKLTGAPQSGSSV